MASDALDQVAHINRDSFGGNDYARLVALSKARALVERLETPWDTLKREVWAAPSVTVSIKIAQESGLFNVLAKAGDKDQSVADLARATKSDVKLLRRLMRFLAVSGFVEETTKGHFKGTEKTRAFTTPGFLGGMDHLFTQVMPTFQAMPEFLAKTEYKEPEDTSNGPFQHGMKVPDDFFGWLGKHKVSEQGFNDVMAVAHERAQRNWFDTYPLSELTQGVSPGASEAPLLIDIGGGIGRDIENVRKELLPNAYRLMVQDLPAAIEQGRKHVHESVEGQPHDFFKEQPVRGARAYFMHSILQDWPDSLCLKILNGLRPAMKVGYSKLLICETVLPDRAQLPMGSSTDLIMMGLLCAKERTSDEWKELFAAAGFRLVKIWGQEDVAESVIEAEPVA